MSNVVICLAKSTNYQTGSEPITVIQVLTRYAKVKIHISSVNCNQCSDSQSMLNRDTLGKAV